MRTDLNNDNEPSLSPEVVKQLQAHLKADPRKRLQDIHSTIRTVIIVMAVISILAVAFYYGTMLFHAYQISKKQESKYIDIIKTDD